MKKKRFTQEQIAFALRQSESGVVSVKLRTFKIFRFGSDNSKWIGCARSQSIFKLLIRILGQSIHIQVSATTPLATRYMPQTCGHEHQGTVTIWECSDNPGSSTYLLHNPLKHVVAP